MDEALAEKGRKDAREARELAPTVAAAKRGDPSAFEKLVLRFRGPMMAYAYSLLRDRGHRRMALDLLAAGATRDEILDDYPYLEPDDITAVLESVGGDKTRAAQLLGISRRTLERRVAERTAEQRGQCVRGVRIASFVHRQLRQAGPQAFGQAECRFLVRVRQQEDELLPAVPRHQVRLARLGFQDGGHVLQRPVARHVPVPVVDVLEMVEVEHHQREHLAAALAALRLRVERLFDRVEAPDFVKGSQRATASKKAIRRRSSVNSS